MISVEEAQNIIFNSVKELDKENVYILDSLGQIIAENIIAPINVPAYKNSAMDGFAVKADDIKNASAEQPKILKVIAEIPAGLYSNIVVDSNKCVRIMTGGRIPEGADTIVPVEWTDNESRTEKNRDEISILQAFPAGSSIRDAGEDVKKDDLVIKEGQLIRPAEIGLLASLGIENISVIRRPRVSILATGNEIIDVKEELSEGKIYNSNSYALAALVKQYGGTPDILGIAGDSIDRLNSFIDKGIESDLIVTSGGVSVGDYDLVKDVVEKRGKILFWRVRMKPGKPITFGMLLNNSGRKVPFLGLPGNPVSCMLGFEIFGRFILSIMMGKKYFSQNTINAVIENDVINNDGRRVFSRVFVEKRGDNFYARLTGNQGSGVLTSMVKANGLAIIPEMTAKVTAGEMVKVILVDYE